MVVLACKLERLPSGKVKIINFRISVSVALTVNVQEDFVTRRHSLGIAGHTLVLATMLPCDTLHDQRLIGQQHTGSRVVDQWFALEEPHHFRQRWIRFAIALEVNITPFPYGFRYFGTQGKG